MAMFHQTYSGSHLSLLMVFLTFLLGSPESSGQRLYPRLKDYIVSAEKEFEKIPGERQEILKNLGEYIVDTESKYNETQLLFVCHENARRSQFAQIWAQTAAHYYRLKNIKTYSGGIHETAINYRILESLKRAGFNVTAGEAYSENPVYLVSPGRRYDDMFIFSKRFDYWNNPNDRYATILCSRDLAGKDFDFPGTEKVLSLHYENIDIFDNSPGGGLKNDEICRTFAREMLYLMDHVKKLRKQKRKRK